MGADVFEPSVFFGVNFDLKELPLLHKYIETHQIPYIIDMIQTWTHSRCEGEDRESFLERCTGFLGFQIDGDSPEEVLTESQKFKTFLNENQDFLIKFNIPSNPSFQCGSLYEENICNLFTYEEYEKYTADICWNCNAHLGEDVEAFYEFDYRGWTMTCSLCKKE
jgi:hypothetical protein